MKTTLSTRLCGIVTVIFLLFPIFNSSAKEFTCPEKFYFCTNDAEFYLSDIYDWPEGGVFTIGGDPVTLIQPAQYRNGTVLTIRYVNRQYDIVCDFKIYINDPPNADGPTSKAFCFSYTELNIGSTDWFTPDGGTFSGSYITSDGIFSMANSGPGDHVITYTYTDPETTCSDACSCTIRVINGEANISLNPSDFCDDDKNQYPIEFSPQGAIVTGLGVTQNEDNYYFTPSDAGTGSHILDCYYDYPIGNCDGRDRITVNVYPSPTADCPDDIYVCGPKADPIELPIPNYQEWAYQGTAIYQSSGTVTFNPDKAGSGEHTITLYVWEDNTSCMDSCTFTITVGEMQIDCPSSNELTFCFDYDSKIPLSEQNFTPPGGTFTGDYIDDDGNFLPGESGPGQFDITYTYYNEEKQCSLSCETTVVIQNGDISCPREVITVCANDTLDLKTIQGCSPEGGDFSGSGVNETVFHAHVAGEGDHTIRYHYAYQGCDGWCSFIIRVLPLPEIDCPNDTTVCNLQSTFALPIPNFVEYEYSGPGVVYTVAPMFSASEAGEGTHTITFTVWDNETQCSNSCTFTVTVAPVNISCIDEWNNCFQFDEVLEFGDHPAFQPPGGSFSGDIIDENGDFDMNESGTGSFDVTYTYIDPETGCSAECSSVINIINGRIKCPEESIRICLNIEEINLDELAAPDPLGGTYFGTGVTGNLFNSQTAGLGVHEIQYMYDHPQGECNGWCRFYIEVTPAPVAKCPDDTSLCGPGSDLIWFPYPGTEDYYFHGLGIDHTPNGYYFDPAIAGSGVHPITYVEGTPENGCIDSCTFEITVGDFNFNCPSDENLRYCFFSDDIPIHFHFTPDDGLFYGDFVTIDGHFNSLESGPGEFPVSFYATDENGVCEDSCTVTVTISNLDMICPEDTVWVCSNDTLNLLIEAPCLPTDPTLPPGIETYHGNGVIDNYFYPLIAGPGSHQITYTYDDTTACDGWCRFIIGVRETPELECPNDTLICDASAIIPLAYEPGWLISGNGVSFPTGAAPVFDAAKAGMGMHPITITVWDADTVCSNSCTYYITVGQNIDCPDTLLVCSNALTDLYEKWNFLSNGIFSGTYVSVDGIFDAPPYGDENCFDLQYKISGEEGCSDSCEFVVCLYPVGNIDCPPDRVVCQSNDSIYLHGDGNWNGYFCFEGIKTKWFTPDTPGNYDLWFHQANPDNGCIDSCKFSIQVVASPEIICPNDTAICQYTSPLDLHELVSIENADSWWFAGAGTDGQHGQYFDPEKVQPGTYPIHCYVSNEDCLDSCTFYITVYPVPCVLHCPDEIITICRNGMALNINQLVVFDCIDAHLSIDDEVGVEYVSQNNTWYFDPGKVNSNEPDTTINITAWLCYYYNTDTCCRSCQFKIKVINETTITVENDTIYTCVSDQESHLFNNVQPEGGEAYVNGIYVAPFTTGPNPAQLGTGSHTVWYYYPDKESPCVDSASFVLQVLDPPVINMQGTLNVQAINPAWISGHTVSNYTKVEWTSSGSGYFVDPEALNPLYNSSDEDFNNGGCYLYLHAYNEACSTIDSVKITFEQLSYFVEDNDDDDSYTINNWYTWGAYIAPLQPANPTLGDMTNPIANYIRVILNGSEAHVTNKSSIIDEPFDNNTGYIIKVSEACSLSVQGRFPNPTSVQLAKGWNLMPVLSPCDVDAAYFASKTQASIIKEVVGFNAFWPDKGVSSLKVLVSGKAYRVKVPEAISFEFPKCESNKSTFINTNALATIPEEWGTLTITPFTMLMALPFDAFPNANIVDGDIIGAFTPENLLAGVCEIGVNDVLMLFGDDLYTDAKDGFAPGDSITFKLYRKAKNTVDDLIVDCSTSGFAENTPDDAAEVVISNHKQLEKSGFNLYPNPVGNQLTIVNRSDEADCFIYNIAGQIVVKTQVKRGANILNTSELLPGAYVVVLKNAKSIHSQNFIKE